MVLSVLYQGALQSAQQALGVDRHLACVLQDGVSFLQPALIDDTLSVRAAVVAQLGRGMDIHVICYRNGELSERVAETYFRFVQLDTEGKSQPIERIHFSLLRAGIPFRLNVIPCNNAVPKKIPYRRAKFATVRHSLVFIECIE